MNILIVGGLGFLGNSVVKKGLERGHKITVFDSKTDNNLDVEQVKGNILDKDHLIEVVKNKDVVYNLAGMADIDDCINKPYDAINCNVMGNTSVLNACVENNIEKYIFASSVYVGGNHGGFYATTKKSSELIIKDYHKFYGINYTILRYGTLYGPNANEKNSIYKYLKDALHKREINYTGNGSELREYIHVDDAASLSYEILNEHYNNKTISLTGNSVIKTRDLFSMISEILDNDLKINYNVKTSPGRVTAHYRTCPYSFNKETVHKLTKNFNRELGESLIEILERIDNAG